jgi:flagellum-specific peptidoglycan hydrolase FlgJ
MSKVKEDTAKVDNTAVVKPKVFERLRVTPRKYELVDLGGTPSNDTRTPAERNKDYLHPIKGAKERFKASMSNETNPLVGIERTILPSAAGAALVTTPIALAKGAGYGFGIDKLTGGWGNMVERTTGIPSEIAQYTNPGAIIGGAAGYRLDQKNLLSKFIKGDADLAWNPINKNHWIFNKEARTASNIGMAITNRLAPFLQGAEKLNGKRDMRKKFVKSSRPTYKRRIRKGQVGMRFVSYVPVSNPIIDYTDITNPINPFSEYYIPTTYNTEQALVVPEREDSKSDTVEETPVVASKPIAEPVVNKPVASKVVNNTANSTWSSPYKDRSKWAADLTNAYKRAGITNDNAIRMLVSQDALESAWGRSAQGKFNFGNLTTGAKWKGDYVTGNDHDAAGNPIKQKFRSYNSMDEYAADKVQFLKRLYDFDENDDINKFVAKLTGSNKGKRRYAEAGNYAKLLTGVYNGISKGQNGLVVQRRDAIKDYTPQIPLSPIKRTYMPTQLPVLSQDNRTGWEKEVSALGIPAINTLINGYE